MRYYIDTEFNGWGGAMISFGMVNERGSMLYLVEDDAGLAKIDLDPWVAENVVPLLYKTPAGAETIRSPLRHWGSIISAFYGEDDKPHFFADWPSDIADLCTMLISGPGESVPMPHQTIFTCLRHIDVYPTSLTDAVQHHALWDALALRRWVEEHES